MRENGIRYRILKWLNSLPNSDFEVSPPGSITGKPDITGCLNGRYVAVEVKIPGKHPTRIQDFKLRKLQAAGAIVIVAHSVEEARRELEYQLQLARFQDHRAEFEKDFVGRTSNAV